MSDWWSSSSRAATSGSKAAIRQHESTPLGWAAFGSVHRRAKEGDYVGVIDRLVAAGANINVPGNGGNETYLGMAEGNDEVQQALRRHGARA